MCDVNQMTQAKQQRCIFSWRNKNTASLGGWKSKIKVSAGLISWSLTPWFVDSRLLLPGSPRGFPAAHVCVLTTCDKDTSRPGVGVAQMISLYLSSLCQGPISKCTHILRNWGFGLEHTNFGGDTIQPTAVPHPYLLTLTTWVHLRPLFFLATSCGMWNFPNQGSNLCPLQWKWRVLTTGPPGKSLSPLLKPIHGSL